MERHVIDQLRSRMDALTKEINVHGAPGATTVRAILNLVYDIKTTLWSADLKTVQASPTEIAMLHRLEDDADAFCGPVIARPDVVREFRQVIQQFEQSLGRHPVQQAAGLYDEADRLDDAGDYPGAVAAFTRAIDAKPWEPANWSGRAFSESKAGNHDAAIRDAEFACKLAPHRASLWSDLAGIRYRRGDVAGATESIKNALNIDPHDEGALKLRASMAYRNAVEGTLAEHPAMRQPAPASASIGARSILMSGTALERILAATIIVSALAVAGSAPGGFWGIAAALYPVYTGIYNLRIIAGHGRRATVGVMPAPSILLLLLPPDPRHAPKFLVGAVIIATLVVAVGLERLDAILGALGFFQVHAASPRLYLPVLATIAGTATGVGISIAEGTRPDVYTLPGWMSALRGEDSRPKLERIRQCADIRLWKPGGSALALQQIEDFAQDEDWRVRAYAAFVLGERLSRYLERVLDLFSTDSDWRVRITAARALGFAFTPDQRAAGVEAGRWSREDIEASAKGAKEQLQRLAEDGDARVKVAAHNGLKGLGVN